MPDGRAGNELFQMICRDAACRVCQMDVPEMDVPEMDVPEMDVSEMNLPEMENSDKYVGLNLLDIFDALNF